MEWEHSWVEYPSGIIDGNADAISENPIVGAGISVRPYWGPRGELPSDRKIPYGRRLLPADEKDSDVVDVWLPDLRAWLHTELLK